MKRLLFLLFFTLPSTANTQSRQARQIQGLVVDQLTGLGVDGASVRTQDGGSDFTDSEGKFQIETSEQNDVQMDVQKTGYIPWQGYQIISGTGKVPKIELVREESITFKVYGRAPNGQRIVLKDVEVWLNENQIGTTSEPGLLRANKTCNPCSFFFKKSGWISVDTIFDPKMVKGLHNIIMNPDPSSEDGTYIRIHQGMFKHTQRLYNIIDHLPETDGKSEAIRIELDSIKAGYQQVLNMKWILAGALESKKQWYTRDNAIFKILYETACGSRIRWNQILKQRKSVLENVANLKTLFKKKNEELNSACILKREKIPGIVDELVSIGEKIVNKTLELEKYGQKLDTQLDADITQLQVMLDWEESQIGEPANSVDLDKNLKASHINNKIRVDNLKKRIH